MTGFESRPVESVISRLIDYRGKTPPKSDAGIRLVTAKCIKDGIISPHSREYISEETYESWMRRGFPAPGDLLVTTEAPLGEVARVPDDQPIALAQRVILLSANQDVLDPYFLYCAFRSPVVQERLQQRSSGTTVSGIRQPELRRVEVPFPPLSIQRQIGDVLAAFDELLLGNSRRIEILEDAVGSIYREWFVRLRFPGHASYESRKSPLGDIPRPWRVGELSGIAELRRTNINPGRFPSEVFAHCSIPAYDAAHLPSLERGASIKAGKYLVDRPVVLVSKLNPRIRRVWLAEPAAHHRTICSTEFLPLGNTNPSWLAYLYGAATSESMGAAIVGLSGGTSTSHQRASPDDLLKLPVLIPEDKVVADYGARVSPALEAAASLRALSKVVAEARDLLIPRLVTGQLEVGSLGVGDVFGWAAMAQPATAS